MDYVFYKVYRFQELVRSFDPAFGACSTVAALLLMSCAAILWFLHIFAGVSFPFPHPGVLMVLILFVFFYFHWQFTRKGRTEAIIARYKDESDEVRRRGNFFMILWPVWIFAMMFGTTWRAIHLNTQMHLEHQQMLESNKSAFVDTVKKYNCETAPVACRKTIEAVVK